MRSPISRLNLILAFLVAFILVSCGTSVEDENKPTLEKALKQGDYAFTNKNDTGTINKEQTFAGKPISFYLSHAQIPQVCKDIYTQKRPATDDDAVLALMDSIFTSNKETRPFYFLTLTMTMEKADGAYAEPLGIMAKKFVENNTKEFLSYFVNEPMLTNKDLDQWARTVTGEIKIMAEGHEKEEAGMVKQKMTTNCKACNEQQKQKLEDFVKNLSIK